MPSPVRSLAFAAVAVAGSLILLAAVAPRWDDGTSGLPQDSGAQDGSGAVDDSGAVNGARDREPNEPAAPDDSGLLAPPPLRPVVAPAAADPAAAAALQAWVDDVFADPRVLDERCALQAPSRRTDVDAEAIAAAVTRPGIADPYAVTWTGDDAIVSVVRSDVASGYACGYVRSSESDPMFGPDDAHWAVVRYLARTGGTPVFPGDSETTYPLVCPGNSPWDPDGTGSGGLPPLQTAAAPSARVDVDALSSAQPVTRVLPGGYLEVSVPAATESGDETVTAITAVGPDGYCLGEFR